MCSTSPSTITRRGYSISRSTRHSMAQGLAGSQTEPTWVPGAVASPAKSSSSTSGSTPKPQTSMVRESAMSTMFTVNSPVALIWAVVSLSRPSARGWMPSARIAGSCEKTLKKLIGAPLLRPSGERVVTRATGRGPTKLVSSRYRPAALPRRSRIPWRSTSCSAGRDAVRTASIVLLPRPGGRGKGEKSRSGVFSRRLRRLTAA